MNKALLKQHLLKQPFMPIFIMLHIYTIVQQITTGLKTEEFKIIF